MSETGQWGVKGKSASAGPSGLSHDSHILWGWVTLDWLIDLHVTQFSHAQYEGELTMVSLLDYCVDRASA